MPAPALVSVAPAPAMIPLMVDAPLLVMLIGLLLAIVIAAAVSTSVETVSPVNGVVAPIAPVIVVSPVPCVLTVSVLAPFIVEL